MPNCPAARSASETALKIMIRMIASIKNATQRTGKPAGRITIAIPSGVSAVTIVSIGAFKLERRWYRR